MGSVKVSSKSALHDSRNALLRKALLSRRAELRQSWKQMISAECLESLGSLAPRVNAFLSGPDLVDHQRFPSNFAWLTCDVDFKTCLQAAALGEKIEFRQVDVCPAPLSSGELKKLSNGDRAAALCERYRCPLNIAAPRETEVAEELLRHLMVVERTKFEAGAPFHGEGVLLELNLIGIYALARRDLRSFDALNYFYEVPPAALLCLRAHPRLFAFWLCIYAQMLCKQDWLRCV